MNCWQLISNSSSANDNLSWWLTVNISVGAKWSPFARVPPRLMMRGNSLCISAWIWMGQCEPNDSKLMNFRKLTTIFVQQQLELRFSVINLINYLLILLNEKLFTHSNQQLINHTPNLLSWNDSKLDYWKLTAFRYSFSKTPIKPEAIGPKMVFQQSEEFLTQSFETWFS